MENRKLIENDSKSSPPKMEAASVAQAAIDIRKTGKRYTNGLPVKPKRKQLYKFELGGHTFERSQLHWVEVLCALIIVATVVIIGILADPNNGMDTITTELMGTIGGWTAVGVCVITFVFNYGLFDRKRNAQSAAYLEKYVTDLLSHNEKLDDATRSQEEQIALEKKRQAKAKVALAQLTGVVDQLGDAKTALTMVKKGLDSFLKESMGNLVKMEEEARGFQLGMIDRGIDRLTNLLVYSFYGEDKDGSQSLEGNELQSFIEKLKNYELVTSQESFLDEFPIGLDCYCGDDGEDLIDKILKVSKVAEKWNDEKKASVRNQLATIAGESPDDLEALVTPEHKNKFIDILKENKIIKNRNDYLLNFHTVDTWAITQGMERVTDRMKKRGKKALEEHDRLMVELHEKECELKAKTKSSERSRIDLDDDLLNIAKRNTAKMQNAQRRA